MLKIQFKDRRKPAMWLVDSTLKIGCDPGCDIQVDEDSVDPIHVELVIQQDEILLRNTSTNRSVFVNDIPVIKQQALEAWDIIKVGTSELEIIDPLNERNPPPAQKPEQATVIRPVVSPWMLKADSAPLDGQYFSLAHGFIIGRDDSSDIKLPFSYVSRKHIKISIRNKKAYVEDLKSSNGTYVNAERVESCEIRNGDELRLDQFIFHVIGPELEEKDKPRKMTKAASKQKSAPGKSANRPKGQLASQKVFLHGLSVGVQGKIYEITKADNHISRLLGHHLSTSEISVSARHVYLNESDLGWEIKNDGAADGLMVNGKMQSRAVLQDKDEITVGGSLLKFQCIGSEPLSYAKPVTKSSDGAKVAIVFGVVVAVAIGVYFSGILN